MYNTVKHTSNYTHTSTFLGESFVHICQMNKNILHTLATISLGSNLEPLSVLTKAPLGRE